MSPTSYRAAPPRSSILAKKCNGSLLYRVTSPMTNAKAYSAAGPQSPLAPTTIPRRDPGARDVQIEILFCGVCHSDLHTVRNEWESQHATTYPCVPGHEIAGR